VPALFSDFHLNENLLKSISDTGFTHCTAIQEQALKITLNGNDLFAQSQTGTGKTAAFLISIFENIFRSEYKEQALVLVPTRELAVQIEAEAKLLSTHLGYNIAALFGGVGYDLQEAQLRGSVDLVVGTPGRIIDLSNRGILKLKDFTMAVIDEADRMFDMGFVSDIRKILSRMPKKESRQTMLFSATLDYSVKRLAEEYMYEPFEITISPETKTVSAINQILYHVNSTDKFRLLMGMVSRYNSPRMIIFSNTKRMCEELAGRLHYNHIKAEFLTGDLPQKKRQRIVDQFKLHEIPVLIATDVAARGIHIDDLELVINYDIPQHAENYVHRIGRTARAGKTGTAITFACDHFVEFLKPVEDFIGFKVPSMVACDEDFGEDLSGGKSWKKMLASSGSKSRQGERNKKEQSDRNTYKQNKQHKKEKDHRDSSPKKAVASVQNYSEPVSVPTVTPEPAISLDGKRRVYQGSPEKDRNVLRKIEHRLELDSSDKSDTFNAPSRNPYDRSNRRPDGKDRNRDDKRKNDSRPAPKGTQGKKQAEVSSSKQGSKKGGPKQNQHSPVKKDAGKSSPQKNIVANSVEPAKAKGLTGKIKALFKK